MKLKKLTGITVITVLVLVIGVAVSGILSKTFAAVQMSEQMVSMRDGVKLHTFIYLPDPDLFWRRAISDNSRKDPLWNWDITPG